MDASKQRGSIVLTKQNIDGQDYIRIEYADNQTIALLLSQDKGIKTIGNGSAYIQASTFQLPEFYTRYSPHAYIDYSRVYIRHPKPQREYVLPKGYLELLEQKRYSPSTIKTYRIYFSDFMEYHKGRNIDRLKVADINHYILYLVNEKKSPCHNRICALTLSSSTTRKWKVGSANITAESQVPKSIRHCPKCLAVMR